MLRLRGLDELNNTSSSVLKQAAKKLYWAESKSIYYADQTEANDSSIAYAGDSQPTEWIWMPTLGFPLEDITLDCPTFDEPYPDSHEP